MGVLPVETGQRKHNACLKTNEVSFCEAKTCFVRFQTGILMMVRLLAAYHRHGAAFFFASQSIAHGGAAIAAGGIELVDSGSGAAERERAAYAEMAVVIAYGGLAVAGIADFGARGFDTAFNGAVELDFG